MTSNSVQAGAANVTDRQTTDRQTTLRRNVSQQAKSLALRQRIRPKKRGKTKIDINVPRASRSYRVPIWND